MTIDERLDRLTERHEALTQSVEILARATHDQAKQISDHTQQIVALRDATAALLHIAQIHEQRISGLEEGAK